MGRIKDMTGLKFGKLKVLRKGTLNSSLHQTWECSCECGSTITVAGNHLRTGQTQSCNRCSRIGKFGASAKHAVYLQYRSSARKRCLDFNIEENDLLRIAQEPCTYCGNIKTQVSKNWYNNGNFYYTGIDRVDNNIGYILSNIVSCCSICNRFKFTHSKKYFIDHCVSIVNHMKIAGFMHENGDPK